MIPNGEIAEKSIYSCGIDFGRVADETAIVVIEQPLGTPEIYVIYIETHQGMPLNEVVNRVAFLDKKFRFNRIYCDNTGLGIGPVDSLKELVGGKVEGINFTLKSKAEMFTNLKLLLEKQILQIPDNMNDAMVKKMVYEFLSITHEYTEKGDLKLSHEDRTNDDIICSLALACLYFSKHKSKRSYGLAGGGKL